MYVLFGNHKKGQCKVILDGNKE